MVAGLLPCSGPGPHARGEAGDAAKARRLDGAFGPLWALFREFGSFRVMHAMAEALGLGRLDLPRPILPLGVDDRARIVQALRALDGFAMLRAPRLL